MTPSERRRAARPETSSADADTLARATAVLSGEGGGRWYTRLLPFLGPAFIASVAYIDPGNYATNIQAGAEYGYTLLWVIVASNLTAMVVQTLSAKLGIATGLNLAEMCRERYPRWVVYSMWVLMELVAMATDLAEFLGAAVGFNLLFNIPLLPAAFITAAATFLILGLQRYGFRPLEAVIAAMVGIIAVCYLVETLLEWPNWGQLLTSSVTPRFQGTESVLLAVGILGATVMPHVIFLHSGLTQDRIRSASEEQMHRLFRFQLVDVTVAMGLAGLINGAMLVMAAATFHGAGLTNIASIEEAYRTLKPLLGRLASVVFAVSLLAAGLSSSTVGTLAGQVIMQGFLHWHVPIWIRRTVTMLPAVVVIALGFDPTRTLVLSQVVLSFGIPFALVPLVQFTAKGEIMGSLRNRRTTTALAVLISAGIIALNLYLLYGIFTGGGP